MFHRLVRPIAGVAAAAAIPYFVFSDARHKQGIQRQSQHINHHHQHADSNISNRDGDEQPVAFNTSHYPSGLNAGFLKRDKEQLKAFYTSKFECAEGRDIAAHQVRKMA